jgi:hypothetical protein
MVLDTAPAESGFDSVTVRNVSENAKNLNFKISGFEEY